MIYPLTICFDRYNGVYSGGLYTAWNCDSENVPTEISDDDVTCANFWRDVRNRHYTFLPAFGKGSTVEEAVADLRKKLNDVEEDFSVDESFKEYDEATRVVPVAKVRDALGIAEGSDIFQCIKYRNRQLENLMTELAVQKCKVTRLEGELETSKASNERAHSEMYKARGEKYELEKRNAQLCKRLADIRNAAAMDAGDPGDLVEFIKDMRAKLDKDQEDFCEWRGLYLGAINKRDEWKKKAGKYKKMYEDLKEGVVCALDYAALGDEEDKK